MKWMTDCVNEAPVVCASMLKNRETIVSDLVKLYTAKSYSKIVLVGSGSSNNIASCAKPIIEKILKKKVEVYTPIAFELYEYKFNENALIICLSQSGRSTNTIKAVLRAKQCGYDVASISMAPNSPIGNYCDNVLEYGSYNGETDCFVCRYFASSVLYYAMFALEAGLKTETITKDEHKKYLKQLDDMVKLMPTAIAEVNAFYDRNKEELLSMKRCMFMGIGDLFGLTSESTLKFSETTGIPTNGYEIEEFLHGPAYEVKKDHALFYFDGDPIAHDRITEIYSETNQLTDRVYLITDSDIKGQKVINIKNNIDPVFKSMLFLCTVQIIPGRICEDTGARAITIYNYRVQQALATKQDK